MKMQKLLVATILICLLSLSLQAQTVSTAVRHYTSAEIDGSSTGTFTIGTTVSDATVQRKFHALIVNVTLTDVSNQLTPAVISIGTNSTSYDNISPLQAVGTVLGKIKALNLSGDLEEIEEATEIKVKVGTACLALLGTPTCKFKITVFGIEQVYANP